MVRGIKIQYGVLFIGLILLIAGCNKADVPRPLNLPEKTAEIIESDNSFGFELFRKVLESKADEDNVMISPLSVSLALAMTYNGAEGDTKAAMEDALKMTGLGKSEINDLNRQLVNALLLHDGSVTLDIANSIWYRNDFTVRPEFINVNQEYYSAEVSPLDFSDPKSKDIINAWVAHKTNKRIEEIVDQIKAESFMFLINAIYFKGPWRYEFSPKKTFESVFYLNDNETVPVYMMKEELDINTFQNDLFSAVELPYGKGNWSMFIFLPNQNRDVNDIIAELNTETWNNWVSNFVPSKEVDVMIPKFTFEFESSLKEMLRAMGMDIAFGSSADFSGILEGGNLLISDVKHKTFIEVSEEGTEAAAVTSVEIELTSAGNYFAANRPFLFVITEKSSKAVLFAGKLANPKME